MARRCCWPMWGDHERRTGIFCAEAEAAAPGARSAYCPAHLARSRRQSSEPVHEHDPKRGQGWGGADLTSRRRRSPKPVPTAPKPAPSRKPKVQISDDALHAMRAEGMSVVALAAKLGCGRMSVQRGFSRASLVAGREALRRPAA